MLRIEQESDGLIVIRLNGQIHDDEMAEELARLVAMTKDMKSGRLLYDVRDFEMPTMAAMMVEMRMLPQLFSLVTRFERAAVMAEEPWLRAMAEWEGVMIPGLEIKSFAHKDEKEARAWLDS